MKNFEVVRWLAQRFGPEEIPPLPRMHPIVANEYLEVLAFHSPLPEPVEKAADD